MSTPVSLAIVRAVAPDLPLPVGAVLGARVLSREGDRGTLLLAGARLAARLPEGVAEGDALRVRVQEATGERLVLKIVDTQAAVQPAQAQLAALPALALPGGATARLLVRPEDEAAASRDPREAPRSVLLRYESPALGRVDIALTLTRAAVGASVQLGDGAPRAGAAELQDALADATARPAVVHVMARAEMVSLRA